MELNIYIGQKIKDFRKLSGLTQTELAEKLKTTKQSISRYEKGDRKAGQDILFELCDIFGVSIDDFFPKVTNSTNQPLVSTSPEVNTSDLLSHISDKVVHLDRQLREPRHSAWISHGEQLLNEQDNENTIAEPIALYDDRERIVGIVDFAASAGTGVWQDENLGMEVTFYKDDMAEDYDSIGIVMGHSMEPVLKNGDYLFVKVTTDIPNGAISIWQINGENYVKKFRSNGKPYLESLNPEYDDITLDDQDDIRPLALVVDVYREG